MFLSRHLKFSSTNNRISNNLSLFNNMTELALERQSSALQQSELQLI
jgi:hypothetical protein